jgi:hypothetical protein
VAQAEQDGNVTALYPCAITAAGSYGDIIEFSGMSCMPELQLCKSGAFFAGIWGAKVCTPNSGTWLWVNVRNTIHC